MNKLSATSGGPPSRYHSAKSTAAARGSGTLSSHPTSLAPTHAPSQVDNNGDDEEEDDYMSAAFLTDATPVNASASTPASSSMTYSQRRKLALQAQNRPPPGSALSMQQKRNEGLKRKLDESNKGMSLLQKMGWKEGAALGKTNPGILEPLAPSLHRGRLGIGIKTADEEAEEKEAKRIRLLQGKEDEFRDWRATKFAERQIENDVRKARKICFQLDSAKENTDFSHFWPLALQPPPPPDHVAPLADTPSLFPSVSNPEEIDLGIDKSDSDQDSPSACHSDMTDPVLDEAPLKPLEPLPDLADTPFAGEPESVPPDSDEIEPWTPESKAFEALVPAEQLSQLISTLRERHTYCLYCGCTFTSEQEMENMCPGLTREDH